MVQIQLFGGVSATTDDGEPVDVGPAKCQTVLAALALAAGSAVPVSRLVEMVWGTEPPRTADKTLQSYVTRLRKGLGSKVIARAGAAYRLDVDAEAVDIRRFQRLLDSGELESALVEWTGAPLAGLEAGGLSATVDGLVEQWLGALEVDLERRIEADASASIGALTELTVSYPFREGLWALLMTALYRVGRQADALAAYHRARQHLVEHLGVEPGPRLRELESLILGHDELLLVDRSSTGPALGLPTGTVTFGFCDVDDSTRLWATHRHDMAAAMPRHDELVRGAVDRQDGYVFAGGGESFGVAFHRAADAVDWAMEIQAAISSEEWPGNLELRLRIGLHTGETEERGNGYFGPAVIVAARLAAVGHGGQILASGVTSALLDRSDLRDLGTFRLDGVVTEQRIVQLDDGEHPPVRTDQSRGGNLPRRLGRLIGRADELAIVADALTAFPVVTLVGPGGIGKTRLALAAGRRYEVDLDSGAWLIELSGIASSTHVPRAVADVLDVKDGPGRTLTQSIVSALQSRRDLLILDNCEHVVDGAAALAQAVAEGCADVRVLATSREGLGLPEEQLIAIAPLDPTGAGVELFNERASKASPLFDPDAAPDAVEEICRRLDGIPLAIELAAARTRSLSPAELVERLDDRLRLLTGGGRRGVERHRTLRTTIQWSYDLLVPAEQMLFRRLSIFAGPFDLAAAETVATDAVAAETVVTDAVAVESSLGVVDVDDLLGGLVERSMLIVESGPFGHRFRLLETMRQFGAEHLLGSGNTDLIAERHAQWCLDQVTDIHQLLAGQAEIEGVARLGELWANLRAAVEWSCATGDRKLAQALVRPVVTEIYVRSQSEIGDWAEQILAITPPDDEELIVFGLTWAARRYMRNLDQQGYEQLVHRYGEPDHPMIRYARAFIYSNYEKLAECAPKALAELRRQGDDRVADLFEIAAVALTLLMTGRLDEHDILVTELADRYRAQGPPTSLNWALTMLGTSASLQGRHQRAWQLYNEGAGVDVPDRTHSLRNPLEARDALQRGDRSRAFQILRSYLNELLDDDNMYVASFACVEFINMMAAVDQPVAASRMLGYLDTTGLLDAPSFRTIASDAAMTIAANSGPVRESEQARGRELDDRQALEFMRDVLDSLLAGHGQSGP